MPLFVTQRNSGGFSKEHYIFHHILPNVKIRNQFMEVYPVRLNNTNREIFRLNNIQIEIQKLKLIQTHNTILKKLFPSLDSLETTITFSKQGILNILN